HTLELRTGPNPHKPDWTKLKFHQCDNCPLGDEVEYCPVAVNLATLIEEFRLNHSTDNAFVVVDATDRSYVKETTVQKGLSSIMGIVMVTSDCPILDRLRPMVRFHLPFASSIETIYRSVTMYLMSQYLEMKKGGTPDWSLDKLSQTYKDVSKVNKGMWNRLSNAAKLDANVNALIILNSFGDALRHSIKTGLDEIAKIFSSPPK
ncbi:MAG: DUF6901 family protein, partial [Bacteroidota bacterium]